MKLNHIFTILIITLLTSCIAEKCNCPLDNEILKENIESIKEVENLDSWSKIGFQDYTKFENDTYRLIIYPSWQNSEISEYKLENEKGIYKITINRYKRLDNTENTKLKKIGQTKEILLSKTDWNKFDKLITNECFWVMPFSSKNSYFDGVSWILEVKKERKNNCSNQNYHIISRVADSPKFFELCDKLLNLANSSINEQNKLLDESWTSD